MADQSLATVGAVLEQSIQVPEQNNRPRPKAVRPMLRDIKLLEENKGALLWQCVEKSVAVVPQSVDWEKYFSMIKPVCPWSWAAWQRGEIWLGKFTEPLPLENYQARVYHFKDITPRRLKKIAKHLDSTDPDSEWLWSHPRYRHNSTPVPVLIQQNRARLAEIRKRTSEITIKT